MNNKDNIRNGKNNCAKVVCRLKKAVVSQGGIIFRKIDQVKTKAQPEESVKEAKMGQKVALTTSAETDFSGFGFTRKKEANCIREDATEAGIFLMLSKFSKYSKPDEYYLEDAAGKPIMDQCYTGIQTNDAPVQYLIDQAYKDGYILKKVVCITTPEVEKDSAEGINMLNRFRNLIKTYVKETWNRDDVEVVNISYHEDDNKDNSEDPVTVHKRKYFNLYNNLQENTDGLKAIYVDYTGGLRDTSFLMVAAIRFLEFKEITCKKVIYSDYFGDKKTLRVLDEAYELFQIINGMSEFISSGTTRQLDDVFENENNLIKSIRRFANATNVGDMENLDSYIIDMIKELNAVPSEKDMKTVMITSMSDVIKTKLFGLEDGGKLIENGNIDYYRLIEWCIDNRMFQQAAVLYTEKMPKVYWEKGIINNLVQLANDESRLGSKEMNTFYRDLPVWLSENETCNDEAKLRRILGNLNVPTSRQDWRFRGFLKYLEREVSDYPQAFVRLKEILEENYRGFNRNGSESSIKIYDDPINQRNVSVFFNTFRDKGNFVHYLLYDNQTAYDQERSKGSNGDKARTLSCIKKAFANSENHPKTNDDKELCILLALYLATKMLRNKMSHAAEDTDQEEQIVHDELEAFFKEITNDPMVTKIRISLREEDIENLLKVAIRYAKGAQTFTKN